MSNPESRFLREQEQKCLARAEASSNLRRKAEYIDMSVYWARMADLAEGRDPEAAGRRTPRAAARSGR